MLLDKGANVNLKNKDGELPIHWAARFGILFFQFQILLFKLNVFLFCLVLFNSLQGHTNIVKMLIDRKSDINAKCSVYAETPLRMAARDGMWFTLIFI